jgi:LuxR family maltose regulon positive regulatory protein
MVRLRLAQQDASGALAVVQEATSALGEPPSPLAKAELLGLKARIWIQQGSLREAAQCVEEALDLASEDQGQIGETVALAAARLKVAQSKPGEAVTSLSSSLSTAEAAERLGVALELRILRSLALARQGHPQEAYTDLERALAIAEPEGYVRIFLDEGQPIQRLLAQWLAHADRGILRDYAIHLLSHFDAEPATAVITQERTTPTGDLVEPLSPRELEILHLIALGSTNKEIAQQLVIATGTVKAHTSSIYRKLDVTNRTEAVARARQLSILP